MYVRYYEPYFELEFTIEDREVYEAYLQFGKALRGQKSVRQETVFAAKATRSRTPSPREAVHERLLFLARKETRYGTENGSAEPREQENRGGGEGLGEMDVFGLRKTVRRDR